MKFILKQVPGSYTNEDALNYSLSYIFHFNKPQPLPIRFYGHLGITEYPPAPDSLISAFEQVRQNAAKTIPRRLHHIIISFSAVFPTLYGTYFYFADEVARLFAPYYPVAYAYHIANKTTKATHSHFHFIISTSSTNAAVPPLTNRKLKTYYPTIIALAQSYGLKLQSPC